MEVLKDGLWESLGGNLLDCLWRDRGINCRRRTPRSGRNGRLCQRQIFRQAMDNGSFGLAIVAAGGRRNGVHAWAQAVSWRVSVGLAC